jgi:hypothetical protein
MCFGTGILTLPQIFSGADEAFYRRLSRLDEVVAEGECRTQKGCAGSSTSFAISSRGHGSC